MIPEGVPEAARSRLLTPEIISEPAVYLAQDASEHLSGQRLVATKWSPRGPEGHPASGGLGR